MEPSKIEVKIEAIAYQDETVNVYIGANKKEANERIAAILATVMEILRTIEAQEGIAVEESLDKMQKVFAIRKAIEEALK